jgi:hypothetical protein
MVLPSEVEVLISAILLPLLIVFVHVDSLPVAQVDAVIDESMTLHDAVVVSGPYRQQIGILGGS